MGVAALVDERVYLERVRRPYVLLVWGVHTSSFVHNCMRYRGAHAFSITGGMYRPLPGCTISYL